MTIPGLAGRTLRIHTFGVELEIAWPQLDLPLSAVAQHLVPALPPGFTAARGVPTWRAEVLRDSSGWSLRCPGEPAGAPHFDLAEVAWVLERAVREHVALTAPGLTFIHAGVVGTPQGAVIIPGRSFAGKSTLVKALVDHGCHYLSDEYAVVEMGGHVRAYPRRISLRESDGRNYLVPGNHTVGVTVAIPPAVVVAVSYEPEVCLDLHRGTSGRGVLTLIDNAVAAQARPAEVLSACSQVMRQAIFLHGTRGDVTLSLGPLMDRLHAELDPGYPGWDGPREPLADPGD